MRLPGSFWRLPESPFRFNERASTSRGSARLMALVYAATLNLNRRGMPGEPAALEDVASVVGRWAGVQDEWSTSERSGRREARVRTELLGPVGDLRGWRLQLVHPDSRDSAFVWAATVTAIQEKATAVAVRLERTRVAPGLVPPRDTPAPPGCIPALLEDENTEARDAGRVLSPNVWVVGEAAAPELATLVTSRARQLPIIAFTPRDDDPIDGGVLLERVIGTAHVALIRSPATWRLDGLLPPGFNVYGGAVRIWWPGITEHSNRWDHQLWAGDVSARRIADQVVDMVLEAGLAAARFDPRVLQLDRARRDHELDDLRTEVADLRVRYDAASAGAQGVDAAELVQTRQQLEEAESSLVSQLSADLADYTLLAEGFARENDELRVRAGSAERERDYLRSECTRLRAVVRDDQEIDDGVTAALAAEIKNEVSERGSVAGARQRAFSIGPQFTLIMEAHGDRYHSKIIKACADVISGAPALLARRDDHALREGEGANDPARVRPSDGAEARRCSIEQGAAAARRIHYWLRPDGSVQFASVNVHDDMNIPE